MSEGKKDAKRRKAEDDAIKTLNASIGEADETMAEMQKMSKSLLKEIEDKHEELLFLFSLIEEKKIDSEEDASEPAPSIIEEEAPPTPPETPNRKSSYKNPKLGKIRDLYDKGLSEEEIARALGIGQGEVKLILNLGKGR
jgi:hypothetical protein